MNTDELEQEIQDRNLNAPRISATEIEEKISQAIFHTMVIPGTTTTVSVCVLDGFVLGMEYAACVSPENFNEELGATYANAKCRLASFDKLWGLEGYRLFKDQQN